MLIKGWGNSAEVIKVEHPTKGDDTRSWGPPDAPYLDGVERSFPGESAYFLSVRTTDSLSLFMRTYIPFPPNQEQSQFLSNPSNPR